MSLIRDELFLVLLSLLLMNLVDISITTLLIRVEVFIALALLLLAQSTVLSRWIIHATKYITILRLIHELTIKF